MKTKVESFDDIVFENRNKDYGAYELRRKYSKRGTIALIISIGFFGIAVGGPLISTLMGKSLRGNYVPVKDGQIILDHFEKEKPLLPPPPPLPPVDIAAIKFTIPTIVDSLTNEDLVFTTEDGWEFGSNREAVDTSSALIADQIVVNKAPEVEIIYDTYAIQEKPVFKDGDAGIIRYVAENTKYPVAAQEQGIEGTVYIRFVVTKTGDVGQAKVMRDIDPLLEEEALRVINSMPKWTPGKNNGNPVNVWFVIPVKFVLQN
jgi:periplasmic protein TonB